MRIILRCITVLLLLGSGFVRGQAPVANFTASQTTACAPAVITFTDQSTGSPTSLTWTINGNTYTGSPITVSFLTSGSYSVSLTATNSSGSNTKTVSNYITINPSPTASFVANDTQVCPGTAVNFTSTTSGAGPLTYVWNFNGNTASTANASYTYYLPGSHTVSLAVTNAIGCTTTVVKPFYITVFTPPSSGFTASPQVICNAGGSTTFTANSSGTGPFTYYWEFGDGGTGTGSTITHSYAALGSYTVKLITTDAHGCKDTVVQPGYITVTHITASFTGSASVCVNATATFANTSGGATSATWDFGDGSTGTGSPAYHGYSAAGTYTVRLTATLGGCSDTISHTIVVNPSPVVSFTYSPQQPCPSPVTIQFTNNTTGASSYYWNFGDGNTSSGTNPSNTYLADVSDTVTLTATSAFGCTATQTTIINIYPLIVDMTLNRVGGCAPLTVHFHSSVTSVWNNMGITYPYPVTSKSWNFGDGSPTSTLDSPVHTYTAVGTYTATFTVTTSNGCTRSVSYLIHVGTPPVANFHRSPDTVCVHQPVYFVDSSTGLADAWAWDFGDNGTGTSQNTSHIYSQAGVYTIKHIVSYNGCADTIIKLNYVVVLDPKSDFGTLYYCDTPLRVDFYNSSINYTSCYWLFGDGTNSSTVSPSHTYPGLGSYNVTLITHNSATGCTDTSTQTITLLQIVPNFTANDTAICLGDPVTFTSSVAGGQATRYYWIIDGIPVSDSASAFTYTFTSPGYHTVKLGVKDIHGCIKYITKTNYMLVAHPVAQWGAQPRAGCAPVNITLIDSTAYTPGTWGITRTWGYGDGTSSTTTASSVTHLYTTPGYYDISLVVTDNVGCMDSVSTLSGISVNKVIADFTVSNTTVCQGVPVFFQNLTQGNSLQYYWDFGDGDTSSALSPLHAYAAAGTYTVKLKAHDNIGCMDSIVKNAYIHVQAKPHAAFTLSDTFSICPPLLVQATNNSTGGTQYAWTFGNTSTSVLANPAITYASSGIYDVYLVVTNSTGCKDTAKGRVRILGYAGSLTYTPLSGCAPLTVTFNAVNVSNVPAFIFDFADGTVAGTTNTTITHTYTQAGPYVPKLIMTDNNGCSSSSVGLDTIKVDGIYHGFTFSPYPACVSGTLTFIDTSKGAYSPINSHLWQFHDGTTASSFTASHSYNGPGTYNVTLITTTVAGCKDTMHGSVTFWNLPSISAGFDTTICLTDTAVLQPSGGVSYVWSPASTLSCASCTNPLAFPTVLTQYTVIGTDAHGCKNTDSMLVKIRTKTDGHASGEADVCQGVPVQLIASGGTTYSWLPPTGLNNSHSSSPVATPTTTTQYMVITQLSRCIPDTDYVNVVIRPLPIVDAGPDQTVIAGNTAQIQATGSSYITHWEWTPTDWLSCTLCPAPEATPKRTTTYMVTATTDYNCTARDSLTIFVICDNSQVFVPNTFTPNGNGYNDMFYIHGKGIEVIKSFRIYDRWGEVVFERLNININDAQQGWDGTFKGTVLPPDIYVYTVDAVCSTGESVTWKGDVMLMR